MPLHAMPPVFTAPTIPRFAGDSTQTSETGQVPIFKWLSRTFPGQLCGKSLGHGKIIINDEYSLFHGLAMTCVL
jgi:hypothetical protein